MDTRNPRFAETVQAVFAQAAFIRDVGYTLHELGAGWCETRLAVAERHLQQNGFVHAGVQATMADHTAGCAAASLLAAGEIVLTVEFKINLLRPAVGELLRCRADVLRAGKTLSVVESAVYADDKLCAKAMVTLAVTTL